MKIEDSSEEEFARALEEEQQESRQYRMTYHWVHCGWCSMKYPTRIDTAYNVFVIVCPNCDSDRGQQVDFKNRLAAEEFETWRPEDMLETSLKQYLSFIKETRFDPFWDRLETTH